MPDKLNVRLVRWHEAESELRAVREAVFVREQNVPAALEWDESDAQAWHVVARGDDGNPIGTARLTAAGQIGRMAVLRESRRRGAGSALLAALLAKAAELGMKRIFLHAQSYAVPFYRIHGFESIGEVFFEAGLPHVEMVLSARSSRNS